MKNTASCLRTQRGSTMIETMVALFVLAIGLMGALAMQMNSMRDSRSASYVAEAQVLAADMVSRIMAYDDIDTAADDSDYAGVDTAAAPALPGCAAAGCTQAQLRDLDVASWAAELTSRLPAGRGTVSSNGGVYTVTVMWDANLTGAQNVGCGGNPQTDLTCYRVEWVQ